MQRTFNGDEEQHSRPATTPARTTLGKPELNRSNAELGRLSRKEAAQTLLSLATSSSSLEASSESQRSTPRLTSSTDEDSESCDFSSLSMSDQNLRLLSWLENQESESLTTVGADTQDSTESQSPDIGLTGTTTRRSSSSMSLEEPCLRWNSYSSLPSPTSTPSRYLSRDPTWSSFPRRY